MTARHYITKYLSYPLHETLKRQRTPAAFRAMQERAGWSRERLDAYTLRGINELLSAAQSESPFYRELLRKHGIGPEDMRSLAEVRYLPCLTKDDVRRLAEEIATSAPDRRSGLIRSSTGGSTGAPMQFYVDRRFTANGWAACWRARAWWGLDWGDSCIWLWGSPIETSASQRVKGSLKRMRDLALNRQVVSAFDMTPAQIHSFVNTLRREQPRYLYSYAGAIYLVAEAIRREGLDLGGWRPAVIFTTSETLLPHMRDAVESVFRCPVSVEYGSRECSFVAHECPAGSLHIHSDRVYVEVLDGDKPASPGGLGEIVVTVLDNFATPLIRYRTGDVGAMQTGTCLCGMPFPVLRSVEGRSDDFLLTRDGKLVHGQGLVYFLRDIPAISRFRVTQQSTERLTIELVPASEGCALPLEYIEQMVNRVFEHLVSVEFIVRDELPPSPSGKYRTVISNLGKHHFRQVHRV